jgi:hypothetical protein
VGTHSDQFLRLSNLTNNASGTFVDLNTGSTVLFTALVFSPWSPVGKSTLFIGSESGRLFRVQEAQTDFPVVTEIGGTGFPAASISCIAMGKSEDTLMVTFSNYGVLSVWQTTNGGQVWTAVEGNLPDMPVRWALYHPQNNRQAMIATETGIWECTNLSHNPVVWEPVNYDLPNVRVDMLQIRKSDNTVLAATHGRGLFTTTWDISTGVKEMQPGNLTVFPNPAPGKFYISTMQDLTGNVCITITDLTGKQVYREIMPSTRWRFSRQINLEDQPKGTYLVTMTLNDKNLLNRKILIY